ncbi:MFS family permease [Rhizomicrobium palustre]|uniref:MFS family permease n=1 Tax=Rhizomicrobium palustre TaxID=189966 RepID=A0A846MXT9_9PROT|nr:MFS transporter [Rhizomicrobium palustre]NIK87830.1 MFS family permease [Rhizomicrobium palustre]
MVPQLASLATILFTTLIFLTGNGLLNTLIPVRAHLEGFPTLTIGLIGSAYFAGFVLGCFTGPRWLNRVGHVRTFSVCAALCAAVTLIMSIFVADFAWLFLRALFGFAAANIFITLESWLNDKVKNETRGVVFAAYLGVNFAGMMMGQLLFATARPSSFVLFSMATIFYTLCLVPVGLTDLKQPAPAPVRKLRPWNLFRISPVGVAGCIAVGFANNAMWTLAPVYAQSQGLSSGNVALFMVAFTMGGTLVQIPVGRLSDHIDRRWVMAGTCALAATAGILIALYDSHDRNTMLWSFGLFGIFMLPLYALSVAHANDRMPKGGYVEASATLLLINSIASVIGPTFAASVMDLFGARALFFFTASVHSCMLVFTLFRLTQKSRPPMQEHFTPLPPEASPSTLELVAPKHDPAP